MIALQCGARVRSDRCTHRWVTLDHDAAAAARSALEVGWSRTPLGLFCPEHTAAPAPVVTGTWTISAEDLLNLLRQAAAGHDPDMLYAELYANGGPSHG